jgi:hypothetical protein
VLKLNLNPTCFPVMTTFYASTLKAWHNMNPTVNPNLLVPWRLKTHPHTELHPPDSTHLCPQTCFWRSLGRTKNNLRRRPPHGEWSLEETKRHQHNPTYPTDYP